VFLNASRIAVVRIPALRRLVRRTRSAKRRAVAVPDPAALQSNRQRAA
jgi:hypothetical protein